MSTKEESNQKVGTESNFALNKQNYRLMLIGIGIVALGFILMIGGGSEDPMVFNEDIFSPRRITIAPIVAMIGYGFIFWAILKRDK